MMRKLLMVLWRPLAALCLGGTLSLAYAPHALGWTAWFFPAGLFALLWSTAPRTPRRDFWAGFRMAYLAGLGFWVPNVWWVGAVSEQAGWVSALLLGAYLALYFGLWGGFASTWGRLKTPRVGSQPAFSILLVASLNAFFWCGLEWLRGLTRLSHNWDGLGVPLLESAFVIAQAADLVGVKGLAFLPVFCGAILVQCVRGLPTEAASPKRRVHWEVIGVMLLICGTFSYGFYRLNTLYRVEKETIRTVILQRNIPLSVFRDPSAHADIYDELKTGMEEAFATIHDRAQKTLEETGEVVIANPELVLWPESSFPSPIYVDPDAAMLPGQSNAQFFEEEIRPYGDFYLITGANEYPTALNEEGLYQVVQAGPFYNTMAFFSGSFASYQRKAKNHLMPFGEYLPLEQTALFRAAYTYFSGQAYEGSFSPATDFSPQQVKLGGGKRFSVVPLVCYEDTVGSLARRYVRPEPQVLINVTNNGWFAGTACAEKHFQNARFRAIELRRPLARAANTGVSAVVDITGSLAHPKSGEPQILRSESGETEIAGALEGLIAYPVVPVQTLYGAVGDLFSWGGGILALFFGLLRRFSRE